MSVDLKEELIPKMKATLAEAMNRNEATREESASSCDPPDRHIVRSMSVRFRAKLRPVPSRRAISAQALSRRRTGRRAETEDGENGTAPQAEGEEYGSMPQAIGKDGSTVSQAETPSQPSQTDNSEGNCAGKTSEGISISERGESTGTSWEQLLSNKVPLSGSSATVQISTAPTCFDAVAAAATASAPTTPVSGRAARRARSRGRRPATLPREPRSPADGVVTPSTPHALSAPPPVMPTVEDPRPPLPKLAISRGRNGIVHKKLIYDSRSHLVPKEIEQQDAAASAPIDQRDEAKSKHCFPTRKAMEMKLPESENDENGSNGQRRRRRRKQRSLASTAAGVSSADGEGATAADTVPGAGNLPDKCEVHDLLAAGDVSMAPTEDNSQLLNRDSVKRAYSFAHRGRGRCGTIRQGGGTASAATSQTPLVRAVLRYARTGRVPRDWPVRSEADDCSGLSGAASEPGAVIGNMSKPECNVTVEAVDAGKLRSLSAVAKPTTADGDMHSKGPNCRTKRKGGGCRLANPSPSTLRMREYRARRRAMGGQPLGRAKRKRIQENVPVGDPATAGGSTPTPAPTSTENVAALSSVNPAVQKLFTETNAVSVNETHKPESGGEEFDPPETCDNSPRPSVARNRPRRRLRTRVGFRRINQRTYQLSRGRTLGGRSKRSREKFVAPEAAAESTSVSSAPVGDAPTSSVPMVESQGAITEKVTEAVVNSETEPLDSALGETPKSTADEVAGIARDSVASIGTPGSTAAAIDSAVAMSDCVPRTSTPNVTAVDMEEPDEPADKTQRRRGPRKRREPGKQRRFPAGETLAEYKRRMKLLHSGRTLPLPRGRPVGPVLLMKRFLRNGWQPLFSKDLLPTPEEDSLIWETVMEVSTDVDGNYAETFDKIEGEANRLYKNARAALEIEELIEMEEELGAGESFTEAFFCTLPERMSALSSDYQPLATLGDKLTSQETDEQATRRVLRVRSLEEPERSVHIAYRGERGEQVDVIDGFRFVSFSKESTMARFTRREEQRARRLKRRERRKANRQAAIARMKAERIAGNRMLLQPPVIDYDDPDWDPFLDLSDTELGRTKLPELDRSSSSSPDLGEAVGQEPTLESDALEMSELPFVEPSTASTAPDHHGQSRDRNHGHPGGSGRGPGRGRGLGRFRGRGRGRGRGFNRGRGRGRRCPGGLRSGSDMLQDFRFLLPREQQHTGASFVHGGSRPCDPYEQIGKIVREAFASSRISGSHPHVEHDPALAERLKALATSPATSEESGIFSSPELDSYLRDHGALRVSFRTPGVMTAASVVRAASPPPTTSQQRDASPPPPPRPEREPGEPRCRTVLERLTWLGYCTKEELEEGRAKQLADAAERAKAFEPESKFEFESIPVSAVLRPRRPPASPRERHMPLVSRAGRLLPLSGVTDCSLAERSTWDHSNVRGTSLYAYDQHNQLLVRGSVPRGRDPYTSHGFGAFCVATRGQIVRPDNVEARVNAWRDRECRVDTVPVDCVLARMAASAVGADFYAKAVASGKSSPQIRAKKRKLVTDTLGQHLDQQDEEGETRARDVAEKKKRGQEPHEKNPELKEREQRTKEQQLAASEPDTGKGRGERSLDTGQNDSIKEKENRVVAEDAEVIVEKDQLSPIVEVDTHYRSEEKENDAANKLCQMEEANDDSSRSDTQQETREPAAVSGNSFSMETDLDKRTPCHAGSSEDNDGNLQRVAATETTASKGSGDVASVEISQLVNSEESYDERTIAESRASSSERETGEESSGDDLIIDSESDAHSDNDTGASDDEMKVRPSIDAAAAAPSSATENTREATQEADIFQLSMGTDMLPHKTLKSSEQLPATEVRPLLPPKCRTEMLRLGLPPPQQTPVGNSSTADQRTVCSNEFCRLGCVCSSLTCTRRERTHCGREECMLVCSCADQTQGASPTPSVPVQAIPAAPACNPSPVFCFL